MTFVRLVRFSQNPIVVHLKKAIRDGGSTVLYTAYIVDTVDAVYTVDTVYTFYTVDTVYTVYTVNTVCTSQTALHCLNSSIYAYIYVYC